jgi:hypothetical protein
VVTVGGFGVAFYRSLFAPPDRILVETSTGSDLTRLEY